MDEDRKLLLQLLGQISQEEMLEDVDINAPSQEELDREARRKALESVLGDRGVQMELQEEDAFNFGEGMREKKRKEEKFSPYLPPRR